MRFKINLKYLFLVLLVLPSCQESPALRSAGAGENRPSTPAKQEPVKSRSAETIFTKEPSLSFEAYEVSRQNKRVNLEGINTEVSYAVLKKDDQVVAQFDGLYHPAGNTTDFGFFPFLGGETKQLAVEQATPRNWHHWIVSLFPDAHVIFDSSDFGVDGELQPVDIDGDGVYEFSKMLVAFYAFENLPSSESPFIDILFKYDESARKYLPANHIFQDQALKGIEKEIRDVHSNDEKEHLSRVLHILLRYVYAGREQEGWAFYEKEYQLANKNQVRSGVLEKLGNEPVYKFIHQKPQAAKQE